MARFTVFLPFFVAVLALSSPAPAADLSIEAFMGSWKGSAISENEVSVHFHVEARDIGVTFRKIDTDQFKMISETIQRKKGDPENPTEKLKTSETTFEKGQNGIWWATDNGDPRNGGILRWARIEENALIVNTFAIREDGKSQIQAHHRAITDRGMELVFTSNVDGELIRTVKGQLVRVQ